MDFIIGGLHLLFLHFLGTYAGPEQEIKGLYLIKDVNFNNSNIIKLLLVKIFISF